MKGRPLVVAKSPQTICFRASDEERDMVDKVAQVHGESMSAFLRTAVLEYCEGFIEDMGVEQFVQKVQALEEEREKKRQKAERLTRKRVSLAQTIASSGSVRQDP